MKKTLVFLLEKIVDHPEAISVDEEMNDSRTLLTIHAHEDDFGKIIGKSGRIIKALRDLMKLMATKQNVYVDVVLAEELQKEA